MKTRLAVLQIAVALAVLNFGYGQEILVPRGSNWRYLDAGYNPNSSWTAVAFDDSSWKTGRAQLGYGDGDEVTVVGYGPVGSNKFVTTWFRHKFSVTNSSRFSSLKVQLLRDDGAVVYLNGRELFRSNMPSGTINSNTLASSGISGAAENTFYETALSSNVLVDGFNVLAVEVHQNNRTSSDISFDLELVAAYPPIQVTLVSPGNGSDSPGTPALLEAVAVDPHSHDLTVTFSGRPAGTPPGPDFTIIAIPDTQYYVSRKNGGTPEHFTAQTDWIVANKAARNIVFVTQLGDCVENGDNGGNDVEWQHATNAMYRLENPLTTLLEDGLPYGIAVGNHDQSPGGQSGSTVFYNQYFGEAHFGGRNYYGGHHGTNNDNHYELFSASGLDFIIIHLEYDPAADTNVLQWADGLLKAYANRRAIVVSHWIINAGFQASFSAQGQAIYNALKANENLFLMLCGHVAPPEGQRTDVYNGNTVYTLMSDYQSRTNGGNGWLRILEFSPSNNVIRVKTYSPTLNQFETDADSQFTLAYNMQGGMGPFSEIATGVAVSSGTPVSAAWPDLIADNTYEWRVTASDGMCPPSSATAQFTVRPQIVSASADTDGDGMTDACEILAGTDPANASSVLRITSMQVRNGLVQLTWHSVPGRLYRVCGRPAAGGGNWSELSQNVSAAGSTTSWSMPIDLGAPHYFYQVRVVGEYH